MREPETVAGNGWYKYPWMLLSGTMSPESGRETISLFFRQHNNSCGISPEPDTGYRRPSVLSTAYRVRTKDNGQQQTDQDTDAVCCIQR